MNSNNDAQQPKATVQQRPSEGTVHPFYDWSDDPFRCRNCGHTILPGEIISSRANPAEW